MDFFQFLQKSCDSTLENTNKKSNKKNKELQLQDNQKLNNNQKLDKDNQKLQLDNQQLQLQDNQETTVYKNIKRGDFIKIIHVKDSNLNSYKGYIGEIREYRKDQDFAVIFLHTIPSHNAIRFPIQHFIKID